MYCECSYWKIAPLVEGRGAWRGNRIAPEPRRKGVEKQTAGDGTSGRSTTEEISRFVVTRAFFRSSSKGSSNFNKFLCQKGDKDG
jgi:hypothetical protein